MTSIRTRVRHPGGVLNVQADQGWTIAQLIQHLRRETGVQNFTLNRGFPPQPLPLGDEAAPLVGFNLNGETLTMTPTQQPDTTGDELLAASLAKESETLSAVQTARSTPPDTSLSVPWPEMDGCMMLRVMADDNSCLFTALSAALVPDKPNPAPFLRDQIASYILSHRDIYTKAILDNKTPEQYVSNLRGMNFWGGYIETSVLSEIYNIQIVSVDVKTGSIYRSGEDKKERCLVLYSGIHYDRIVCAPEPDYPPETDITRFEINDESAINRASELAGKMRESGYFTDTNAMVVQCTIPGCDWLGEIKSANDHIKQTGHEAFEELKLDDQ